MCVSGGGPAGCHGEGETGTGRDESQAVVNSTLPGREGRSPDRHAGREAEAPGGGPGDEVRRTRFIASVLVSVLKYPAGKR